MKLVEILARELNEWPVDESLPLRQANDDSLYVSAQHTNGKDTNYLDIFVSKSENQLCDVTRAQWEAERDRLAAMDGNQSTLDYFINNFEVKDGRAYHKETGYVWVPEMSSELGKEAEDWRAEAKKQYEQELWDKVAVAAMTYEDQHSIGACFDTADAFMAERAKCMKK